MQGWELDAAGYQLRDATLEDVEHYFVYNADLHASFFLDGPSDGDGLRIAA